MVVQCCTRWLKGEISKASYQDGNDVDSVGWWGFDQNYADHARVAFGVVALCPRQAY
jgi:hypothetical protein